LITIVVLDMGLTWRAGYVVMAVLMVVFGGLMMLSFTHWTLPEDDRKEKKKHASNDVALSVLKMPVVWLGIGVMFLSAGIETTTGQLSNNLLVDGRGYDPRMVATWISLYWFSFTIGRFVTGLVIDRMSHNLFLRGAMLLAVVGSVLMALHLSPELDFLGLAIIGFAMAPVAPTVMGDTPSRVGVGRAPNIIGYQNVGAGFGIAFFPSLAGVLAEYINLEMISIFLVVITVLMFIVHEFLNYRENK
jgi:fucose permease